MTDSGRNPQVYKAVMAAIDDANDFIVKIASAEIFLRIETPGFRSPSSRAHRRSGFSFAPAPENVMKIYGFMHTRRPAQKHAATWRELFSPTSTAQRKLTLSPAAIVTPLDVGIPDQPGQRASSWAIRAADSSGCPPARRTESREFLPHVRQRHDRTISDQQRDDGLGVPAAQHAHQGFRFLPATPACAIVGTSGKAELRCGW